MTKSLCSKKGLTKTQIKQKEAEMLASARLAMPKEVLSFFNKRVKNSIGYGSFKGLYIQEYKGKLLMRMFNFTLAGPNGTGFLSKSEVVEYMRQLEGGYQVVCNLADVQYCWCYSKVLISGRKEGCDISGWDKNSAKVYSKKQNWSITIPAFYLNEKEAIEAFGKYSGWEDYPKSYNSYNLFEYLCRYRKEAGIEYLVKNGYSNFVKCVTALNTKGRNFKEIFGVDKKYADVLKKSVHPRTTLRAVKEHPWIEPEDVQKLENLLSASTERHLEEKDYKYFLKNNVSPYRISFYEDYLRMAEKCGIPVNENRYKYPKDLQKAHDEVQDKYDIILNKKLDEGIEKVANQMQKYVWTSKKTGLCIVPAKSSEELIEESKQQHNCVRTYIKDVADGKTSIFFVRKTSDPNSSFVTLELKGKEIRQVYAERNTNVDEKTEKFVLSWKKRNRFTGWNGVNR